MNEVIIAGVTVPIAQGPLGICMSGGADSSLLLYILLSNTKETIHIFTLASVAKARTSAMVSANVIEKCIQLTGNANVMHYTTYVDFQNNEKLFAMPKEFCNRNIIEYYYSGVTANPPSEISISFIDEAASQVQEKRNPLVTRDIISAHNITPFTNVNKVKIAEMYAELGITDTVFPLTRSCELPNSPGYFGHCDDCWFCKERKWGFGRLV